jgi:rod shape-determining protein MreD
MHSQAFVRKWIYYVLIGLGCLFLQSMVCNYLRIWGVHPVLLPLMVCVVAAYEPNRGGLTFALVAGVLADLTTTTIIPCFYTVSFVLAALAAIAIGHNLITQRFWCAVASSVAGLLVADLLYTVILIYHGSTTFLDALSVSGREILISLPFALLLAWIAGRVKWKYRSE